MPDHAALSKTLTDSLQLSLPPIAVCLTDDVPEGLSAYEGRVAAGCRFWEEAATRAFSTSTHDHELCAIGVHTHHLTDPSPAYQTELGTALRVMNELDYVREQDVAQIPVVEGASKHVVYSPLASTPLPPDVVLLFASSRQGLVITEAVQRVEADGAPPALGRPACAIVPQAINTGRAALSLGCCGARAYLDALSDDVALWAIPGEKLADYAASAETLANANDVLGRFHSLRRHDVEAGKAPSVDESLARLESP